MEQSECGKSNWIVFVVGVGRSGTSLIQSILSSHSDVSSLKESGFVRRYIANRKLQKLGVDERQDVLSSDPRVSEVFSQALVEVDPKMESVDVAVYRRVIEAKRREDSAKFVVDKDPRLIELLPLVSAKFSDAWVVHIVRDPRDVLVSKMKANWSKSRWWPIHVFANRVQFNLGSRFGRELFQEKYVEVQYEKLIRSPNEELIRICKILGVEYQPEMLDRFPANSKDLMRPDEMQWKKETLQPVNGDNCGKWETELSRFQIALAEKVCWRTLDGRYQQSQSFRELPIFRRWLVRLMIPVLSLAETIYLQRLRWNRN